MRTIICIIATLILLSPSLPRAEIVLASGAGYRGVVDILATIFEEKTGHRVDLIYGNMARVTSQAKATQAINFVLGDAQFLDKAQLLFSSVTELGRGRLVAAYPKGSHLEKDDDLLDPKITRIAIPETSKAIYGKASLQYLKNRGIYEEVAPKLLLVATVPQAMSYVLSGEVDLAMINLTHARKLQKKIGGYILLDETAYSPIRIVLGQMEHSKDNEQCQEFIEFLNTKDAADILVASGLRQR